MVGIFALMAIFVATLIACFVHSAAGTGKADAVLHRPARRRNTSDAVLAYDPFAFREIETGC